MTAVAIEAHNLSKSFRVRRQRRTSLKERVVRGRAPEPELFWALRDASFVVRQGSSLGLIGQNGSGKSTALKVLTGIYRPTKGSVSVNGSVSALLEVGAGFHPELTGRENIRLNATILGFTGREIDRLMDQIIEFADIGDHIDGPIKHYSSGMYVRLGFAVAVMVRPQILLVDEVIAVGDEEFQRKCYDYLYELRRDGTSLVLVSHGMAQVSDLCDEAVWLEQGRVMGHGSSRAIVRSYLDSVNEREAARAVVHLEAPIAPIQADEPAVTTAGEAVPAPEIVEVTTPVQPATAPPQTGLPHRPAQARRGSGEIRVQELIFINESGEATSMLISGKPCKFQIRYTATDAVHGAVFGLGFDNHADFTVGGINNSHLPPVTFGPGSGVVTFTATPLLLAGGRYRVRTQIHVANHVIDAIDEGFTLRVRAPDVEIDGAYLQPGEWEHAQTL